MSSFLPGWFPGLIAAKTPPSLSFIGITDSTANAATHTFTGASIGAADATRRVVVVVHWTDTVNFFTLSSATIAGIAATIHVSVAGPTFATNGMAIISALVPTGTTGNIVLNFSGAADGATIGVYRAINETSASPTATMTDNTISSGVLTGTINIPNNGWVVAGAICTTAGTNNVFAGITEQYDAAFTGAAAVIRSGGFDSGLGLQVGRTVSDTTSPASANGVMAAMSWG